jgi:hypothetical protein
VMRAPGEALQLQFGRHRGEIGSSLEDVTPQQQLWLD